MRYTLEDLRRRIDGVNGELKEMGYTKRLAVVPTGGHGYQVLEFDPTTDKMDMPVSYYPGSKFVSNAGGLLQCEAVVNGYMRGVYMADNKINSDKSDKESL